MTTYAKCQAKDLHGILSGGNWEIVNQ